MDYLALLEADLAKHPVPRAEFPPVFAFSLHKAGSSMLYAMIRAACIREDIPCLNIPTRLFHLGVEDNRWISDGRTSRFLLPGRIYYGFRQLPRSVFRSKGEFFHRRMVLLVRDPRDALVSQYFSFGGRHISHARPRAAPDKFVASLKKTADLDIDAYVVREAKHYKRKLAEYLRLLDFPHLQLHRYEREYSNKHRFLTEVFRHFDIPISDRTIESVARQNDVRPSVEDPSNHIRKGTPGDHREKLRPQTIETLNELFRETARPFGYAM